MKLTVHAKPGSRVEKVERISENEYKVWVTAVPEKGRANEALRRALARHFGISRSRIAIVAGHAAQTKIIEILPAA